MASFAEPSLHGQRSSPVTDLGAGRIVDFQVHGLAETLPTVMPVGEAGGTLAGGAPFFALAVVAARFNTSDTAVLGGYCTPNWSRIA